MLLKIANIGKDVYPFMTLGDITGIQHTFQWNDEHWAYCYAPKSAQECDNICAVNWMNVAFPFKITPVFGATDVPALINTGGAGSPNRVPNSVAVSRIPPYIRPEIYAGYTGDELILLSRDCGFEPEAPHEPDNLKRQLARWCEGRAWANEEVRRLTLELANRPAAAATLPVTGTTTGPVVIKRGRGRPKTLVTA